VYAVRAWLDGTPHMGAAHIGPNATFGETTRTAEVYLIDFSGDIYGRPLAVDFAARVRGTQKFDGVESLVKQMTQDVRQAKTLLEGTP